MIDRVRLRAQQLSKVQRVDSATVTAIDEASGSYTLSYRGTAVGPVWSQSGARYEVGSVVNVVVEVKLVKYIVP